MEAKEGILLDAQNRPIAGFEGTGEAGDRASGQQGARPTWDQFFRERVRARPTIKQITVPGWGLLPLTVFIAALIPIILLLFVAGVAVVVLFKTFISPILRILLGRPSGAR